MKKLLLSALFAAVASASQGAVLVYTWEEGSDIKTEYSGTLDLTGLNIANRQPNTNYAFMRPDRAFYFNMFDYQGYFDATVSVTGGTGPNSWSVGTSSSNFLHTRFGDSFGFGVTSSASRGGAVYVKAGTDAFENGDSINGGSTTFGKTFADMGITAPVTVEFSWSGDSITHYYGTRPPAVPLPAGLPLIATGLGAFAWLRRRNKTA